MSSPCFLALDAGTGSGRAAVLDAEGRLLACAQEEWGYSESHFPGDFLAGYSFDPENFWAILCRAARTAIAQSKVSPADIAGVATTSQREGSVFLDEHGRELLATPNFDSRAIAEGLEVIDRLGSDRLYRLTGHNPPFPFTLSRLLWWRKRFADRSVARFLMISDWATYRLTGEQVIDPSNAGESLLFDVEKQDWSEEIFQAFEIPPSVRPRLVPAGTLAGRVQGDAARATGLLEGTPVFTGGADTQCALLGSGVIAPGDVGAVLGTTTPVQLVLDRPVFDMERQLWVGAHVVPHRWVLESNAGDTGKAYLWLLELLNLKPNGASDYARLEELASQASAECPVFSYIGPSVFDLRSLNPARAAGLIFPYPFGRRRPGPAEFVLGFLESIAFAVRANLEQIEAATSLKLPYLNLGGGMTQGRLVLRLISEVTGIPLRVSQVAETAALGCALLAGVGAGLYPDLETAVRRAVRFDEILPVEPGPARDRYEKWREIFGQLTETAVP